MKTNLLMTLAAAIAYPILVAMIIFPMWPDFIHADRVLKACVALPVATIVITGIVLLPLKCWWQWLVIAASCCITSILGIGYWFYLISAF